MNRRRHASVSRWSEIEHGDSCTSFPKTLIKSRMRFGGAMNGLEMALKGMIFLMAMLFSMMPNGVHSQNPSKLVSEDLREDATALIEMMSYMSQFGYVNAPSSSEVSHFMTVEEIHKGIRLVQRVAGLRETGVLDDPTAKYIKRKRCGVSDEPLIQQLTGSGRKKRFVINKATKGWSKTPVTWRLERSSGKLGRTQIIQDLERAFRLWSDASSLSFQRLDDNWARSGQEEADIVISFEVGIHGDGYKFDGLGAILAHAFPPVEAKGLSGDMHMDEDEDWRTHDDAKNSGSGTSVFVVAAHELGHSLGLDHSPDTNAIMFSGYSGPTDYDRLPEDDQQAIQWLYGYSRDPVPPPVAPTRPPPVRPRPNPHPRTTHRPYRPPTPSPPRPRPTNPPRPRIPNPPPQPPPSSPSLPDLCHLDFDTATVIRRELYIFKDEYMWRLTLADQLYGPTLTSSYWIGLPQDLKRIDAAYEDSGSYDIVFFSGNKYWVFNNRYVKSGYPQHLTTLGLPHHLPNLDAALVWGHSRMTYFFSQNQYWKFDLSSRRMKDGYPKEISNWKGVKYPVSSALRWKDGTTYFFQGKLFWKFNDTTSRVDHEAGKLINSHWFNCPNSKSDGTDTNSVDHDDPNGSGRSNNGKAPLHTAAFININLLLCLVILVVIQFYN